MNGDESGNVAPLVPDHLLVPNPAVATGAVFKLDSRWWWRIRAARFLLATDVNVVARFVTVDYCDMDGTAWIRNPALAVQPASIAAQEYDFANRPFPVSGIAGVPQFPGLLDVLIPPGWQVQINVSNMQAADQLSAIKLYVDKLLTKDE